MALLMMLTVAYFAHKNGWGGDIRSNGRAGKALIETAVVAGWPLAVWGLVDAGAQPQLTVAARWWCCSPPTGSSGSRPCCPS